MFIEARAVAAGPDVPVHLRVAGPDRRTVYLDLGWPDRSAVRITPAGWAVVKQPESMLFRRSAPMQPLPPPAASSTFAPLWALLGIDDADSRMLLGACVAGRLPDARGPYPVLVLDGEPGAGKSTAARFLRGLVDPSALPLRRPPAKEEDLAITADGTWVVAMDNLSTIRPGMSDALCCLATGGGLARRTLYADREETVWTATRPIILTGIDIAMRSDLADRVIVITLPPRPCKSDEDTLNRGYEVFRPGLLGALLDAAVWALHLRDHVRLSHAPRMADFARWVYAAAPVMGWTGDEVLGAYARNRVQSAADVLEGERVAKVVEALPKPWVGTATDLLPLLGEPPRRASGWPTTPRAVRADLQRLAPALRAQGVEVRFHRTGRARWITISDAPAPPSRPSQPSQAASPQGSGAMTVGDGGPLTSPTVTPTVTGIQADNHAVPVACPECGDGRDGPVGASFGQLTVVVDIFGRRCHGLQQEFGCNRGFAP